MAQPVTIRGGKVRVLLASAAAPTVYTSACGFTSRSLTFSKNLEEVNIPDCDDPDKIDWVGRDATSLSLAVNGEGVAAAESVDGWDEAFLSLESVPAKIEIEWPAKTVTWTGRLQVDSLEWGAANAQRVTLNVSMQSDGEFVRTETPAT